MLNTDIAGDIMRIDFSTFNLPTTLLLIAILAGCTLLYRLILRVVRNANEKSMQAFLLPDGSTKPHFIIAGRNYDSEAYKDSLRELVKDASSRQLFMMKHQRRGNRDILSRLFVEVLEEQLINRENEAALRKPNIPEA